jgi:Sec-independent protein translocase protein TatA
MGSFLKLILCLLLLLHGKAFVINRINKFQSTELSRLNLDIFGLGPSEVVIIFGVGIFLYGPSNIRSQLRNQGVKGSIVSEGWRAERAERIERMTKFATQRRRQRALQFINEAVESGDEEVLEKVDEFQEIFAKDI